MGQTIAVMNTKGGVGKSTIVLSIAETLSADHRRNVLVIDSDSQASLSSMLMTPASLNKLQSQGLSIVDYLVNTVLKDETPSWQDYVVGGVSDVDEAQTVYLIPSDMQLTLFEREVSKGDHHSKLRKTISALLADVQSVFDLVLIDCPPGLSVLTESWLREADFHLSPTKADYISTCGLEVLRQFKSLNPEMGFAENLGVLVNMKDKFSVIEHDYHNALCENAQNACFAQAIPRVHAIQHAAHYQAGERSYSAKYPGEAGEAIRLVTAEILTRLASAQAQAQTAAQ